MKRLFVICLLSFLITPLDYSQNLTVSTEQITAVKGDTILVPINITNFSNVGAVSIKLQYDGNVLKWLGAENWYTGFSGALAFGINGFVTISWSEPLSGVTLSAGKMVDLKFEYLGGKCALTFAFDQCEITDVNVNELNVIYTDGGVSPVLTAVHSIRNFITNTYNNKFTFEIYSENTCGEDLRVGDTQYSINYNQAIMNSPELTSVNNKYTSGATSGDYNEMTLQDLGNKINVNIDYSGSSGIGDTLCSAGETICSITFDVLSQNSSSDISWDQGNSSMLNIDSQPVINSYQVDPPIPLPVEITNLRVKALINKNIQIAWSTATEVNNYGFEVERKNNEDGEEWMKLGFITGGGNSSSGRHYSFIDDNSTGFGKIHYRLKQIDNDGRFKYSDEVEIEIESEGFILSQNYPNPFNPSTTINFSLAERSYVKLIVYNPIGQIVATLVEGYRNEGNYYIEWDASELPNGIYIYRLVAGRYAVTKKMTLLK